MLLYKNIDEMTVVTLEEVKAEYEALKEDEATDCETFEDYLEECLNGNGSLEEFESYETRDIQELVDIFESESSIDFEDYLDGSYVETIEPDLSDYNRYLEEINYTDDIIYSMSEFNEMMSCKEPIDIAYMCACGTFNGFADYFKFNGYGNIETLDNFDVERTMKEDTEFLRWLAVEYNPNLEDEVYYIIEAVNKVLASK